MNIPCKSPQKSIMFDIKDLYPSIKQDLSKALDFTNSILLLVSQTTMLFTMQGNLNIIPMVIRG